jgi:hypothetical protein
MYDYMGNPRSRFANALDNPWKAGLRWGTKISEKITHTGGRTKKKIRFRESQARFDSGNIGIC